MAHAEPQPSNVEPGYPVRAEGWWADHDVVPKTIYWFIHASCALVFILGVTANDALLCAATYTLRMFGITGGYHRYFAHKSYKTSRAFQFALALLGCAATQKGPLWWAGHHRGHHKYADVPGKDVHSPTEGLWYSHQGWIFDGRWDDTPVDQIEDFAKYPELVWLNRYYPLPPALLALFCFAFGGLSGLLWGFAISTVLLWHSTYAINSVCHLIGTRPYDTRDTSRNNVVMAILTLGEGWHNNHHHYCASARQGFRWWEIDPTYYVLRGFAAVGLVWDLREPPAHIVNCGKRRRATAELPKAA